MAPGRVPVGAGGRVRDFPRYQLQLQLVPTLLKNVVLQPIKSRNLWNSKLKFTKSYWKISQVAVGGQWQCWHQSSGANSQSVSDAAWRARHAARGMGP